jgi:hypothetical protein
MTEITILSMTQVINVVSGTAKISVINAGPAGPAGPTGPPGSGGGPPGTVTTDKQFSVEPPNWGAHFRAAVNDADTRLVSILVPGDSLAVGEDATDWFDDGYVGQLTAALQAEYGDGGSGFIGAGWVAGAGTGGGQVTTTGAWTVLENTGGIGRKCLQPSTPGNGATVVTVCRGTTIDLFYKTNAAFGTWEYKIDGGSFVSVPLNIAGSIKKVTVTGLSAGDHVVTSKATSGDGIWYGHRGRNATGIIVDNVSVSGTELAHMAQDTTGMSGSDADTYRDTLIFRTMEAMAPVDLMILCLGANDVILDVDDPNWLAGLWNALGCIDVALREFGPDPFIKKPDVIVVAEHIGKTEPIIGFGLLERDWLQIHSILRTYAASTGAAFVDIWARGGRTWEAWAEEVVWASSNTDLVHLNDHGHEIMAQEILTLMDVT